MNPIMPIFANFCIYLHRFGRAVHVKNIFDNFRKAIQAFSQDSFSLEVRNQATALDEEVKKTKISEDNKKTITDIKEIAPHLLEQTIPMKTKPLEKSALSQIFSLLPPSKDPLCEDDITTEFPSIHCSNSSSNNTFASFPSSPQEEPEDDLDYLELPDDKKGKA